VAGTTGIRPKCAARPAPPGPGADNRAAGPSRPAGAGCAAGV